MKKPNNRQFIHLAQAAFAFEMSSLLFGNQLIVGPRGSTWKNPS